MAFKKPREACGRGDPHRSSKGKVEGAGQVCEGSMGAKEMGHGSRDTCVCRQCVWSQVQNGTSGAKVGGGSGSGIFPRRGNCQLSFEGEKPLRFQREEQRRGSRHTDQWKQRAGSGREAGLMSTLTADFSSQE